MESRLLFMYKIPARHTFVLACVLILLATGSTAGEVFTWTDENGQKHFGDRIPLEYQEQSKRVDLNVQRPSEEDVRAATQTNSSIKELLGVSAKGRQTKQVKKKEKKEQKEKREQPSKSYDEMTYEEQMAAYKKSEACYKSCAGVGTYNAGAPSYVYSPSGVMYSNSTGSWGGRDMSNCGHCTSVRKPHKDR